jgi:hypothetical protein
MGDLSASPQPSTVKPVLICSRLRNRDGAALDEPSYRYIRKGRGPWVARREAETILKGKNNDRVWLGLFLYTDQIQLGAGHFFSVSISISIFFSFLFF